MRQGDIIVISAANVLVTHLVGVEVHVAKVQAMGNAVQGGNRLYVGLRGLCLV